MTRPLAFHFRVQFDFSGGGEDAAFQSVSGLNVELTTEQVEEGGENRFVHQLPVRTQFTNLVLKRSLAVSSELVAWCTDAFEKLDVTPVTLTVSLLNPEREPLMSWVVDGAWPVKWSVSEFNAEENALAIETLELSYRTFRRLS